MFVSKRLAMKPIAAAIALLAGGAIAQETQLGEVKVTSTTIDDRFASKRDEPSNISVISGKTVDDAHAKDITQVLNSVPGVTAEVQSGDSLKIMLRGIENQRYMGEKPGVAVVIDGVPVFERTGRVNIDLDNIESIKVIKGGASYLFGEDALSGAVIITTKRGRKYAGVTVGAEAGSFDYYKRLARVGMAGEKGSVHLQYTDKGSDDYYFQGLYGSTYLAGNAQLYLSDSSDLTIGYEKSDRHKDSHGTVTGITQATVDPRSINGMDYSRKYDVALEKLNLTYSKDYSTTGNFMAMVYQYKDDTAFWSSSIKGTDPDAYALNNKYHQVQRGFKGEWRDTINSIGWLLGGDIRNNQYNNLVTCMRVYPQAGCGSVGQVRSKDKIGEEMRALYGEAKFDPAKDWTLTFNGRHDQAKLDYTDQQTSSQNSKSFTANSLRAGANYDLTPTSAFYGNISTGFRLPSYEQLFISTSGQRGETIGNPSLRPEHAVNKEIGWRAKKSLFGVAVDLDIAFFQIDRKDYIMATNGQYASAPAGQNPQTWDNIGGVRNRGIELAFRTDPKREYSLNMAYTYIDARFTKYDEFWQTLGNPATNPPVLECPLNPANANTRYCQTSYNLSGYRVPRVPRHQLNATLNWLPSSALRVGFEMDARSWVYADELNQLKNPGRTLFNLLVNYDIKEKGALGAKWSLFGRIDNLFARNYWVTARASGNDGKDLAGKYDGVYNAEDLSITVGRGRVWTAGLSATF